MKELDDPNRYDWKKKQEAKQEYYDLKKKLSKLEICPEESVGMKRLKELSVALQRKAFEEYAVPRIKDAKEGHKDFNDHWKDMTFERWVKETADSFLDRDMPELMKDMPRAFGPFQYLAGWMSFRGKCVGYCELIPSDLQDEAYTDMEPEQMLDYAIRLEQHAKKWEKENPELFSQSERFRDEHEGWSKENESELNDSGYFDYKILREAITWLRFWAEKGHGMWAWY